jgi:formylmethanofuran dehydrogenase subunit E
MAEKVCGIDFEEYLEKAESFHGTAAPGMIAGAYMIDYATSLLPQGDLYDVVCESGHCLPDAVQLLTPCTVGNGWLRIVPTTRYALTIYNKYNGEGVRVFIDHEKIEKYTAARSWFYRDIPKEQQSLEDIIHDLRRAGHDLYGVQRVVVKIQHPHNENERHAESKICSGCREVFKSMGEQLCPACSGAVYYEQMKPDTA